MRVVPPCLPLSEDSAEQRSVNYAGDLQTKGIEHELETYQVQMRVLNESINLKKVPTLSQIS